MSEFSSSAEIKLLECSMCLFSCTKSKMYQVGHVSATLCTLPKIFLLQLLYFHVTYPGNQFMPIVCFLPWKQIINYIYSVRVICKYNKLIRAYNSIRKLWQLGFFRACRKPMKLEGGLLNYPNSQHYHNYSHSFF